MIKQKVLSVFFAATIAFSATGALAADASAEWVETEKGYSYLDDETGKALKGWQTIDGGKYYFKDGTALTGWKKINGEKYYFNKAKKGKMLTGWVTINKSKYYFGSDGKMRTGMRKISGKTYYFGTDGKMRTGKVKINGKTYNFGTDGVLTTGSTSSSSSSLTAPMKNLKWNMSKEKVVKTLGSDKYVVNGSMLMYMDKTPYVYYLFDTSDKLVGYGYFSSKSDDAKTFRNYFTKAGWELEESETNDGLMTYVYTSGKSVGAVAGNDEYVMTMVLSEEFSKMGYDGVDLDQYLNLN